MEIENTLHIAIRLPEKLASEILKVKRDTGVNYLDHDESYPHVSVYFCSFSESRYEELINILRETEFRRFSVRLSDLKLQDKLDKDYTFISFGINGGGDDLQNLHEQIYRLVNPLRGGKLRYKEEKRRQNGEITEEDYLRAKRDGFPYFLDRYSPHVTVGTVDKNNSGLKKELKLKLSPLANSEFVVEGLFMKIKKKSLPELLLIEESEMTYIKF